MSLKRKQKRYAMKSRIEVITFGDGEVEL